MKNKDINKKLKQANLTVRPPIVVVLGHVDHGKSTILDYIRQTNVAEKESGGITQHIGAYEAEYSGKKITFIDTPGHEAFSQMRSRGAKVADIAILVIAAEEGVKPQTKEVISQIKKFKIPTIIALNKIDKPGINLEKIISEIEKEGLTVEDRGGKVPMVKTSAKTGEGIDELLEMILLVADLEELKTDIDKPSSGTVIESYLDSQQGPTATLLVREGVLKKNDVILCNNFYGKVKILRNFHDESIDKAFPSMPVRMVGLNQVPTIGEEFLVVSSEEEAKKRAEEASTLSVNLQRSKDLTEKKKKIKEKATKEEKEEGGEEKEEKYENKKTLNIILKADVGGSLEAIEGTLKAIKQENINIKILETGVNDITEFDVKLAHSTNSIIIGFRVKASNFIFNLARRHGVKIKIFTVIYELVEGVKENMSKLLSPELVRKDLGKLKVLEIFIKEKSRMIIGGRVVSGKIEDKALIEVFRDEEKVSKGKIAQLQQNKKNISEVEKGKEAGILFEGEPVIKEGDILIAFKEEKRAREL